jgi:hypothetical protein
VTHYLVTPSVGCEFIPPDRLDHEDDTAYRGRVALHRRTWERHPCPFTGRVVTLEETHGPDARVEDVRTGETLWIPVRRLQPVGFTS